MPRTLYVRTFDEHLHDQLDDLAEKKSVMPGSILEEALEKWIKKQPDLPAKHHLVLYSDKESLFNFLRKLDDLTKEDWTRLCLGPVSHYGQKLLKKRGWHDVTISPYAQRIKKPKQYSAMVFDKAANEASDKKTCFVGFMTGDIASHSSLEKAIELEKISNSKRDSGIIFCPYYLKDFAGSSMLAILNLIKEHTNVFVLQKNEILELNLHKINHSKTLL